MVKSEFYRFEEVSGPIGSDLSPKSRTKERVILGIIVLALIGALIGVSVYFSRKNNELEDENAALKASGLALTTESVSTQTLHSLHKRIDCIPEAQGKYINATLELCQQRKCIFQKSGVEGIPDCYFAQNVGYKVKVNSFKETVLGYQLQLEINGFGGPFGNDWKYVDFNVEMRGNDIIRFMVI